MPRNVTFIVVRYNFLWVGQTVQRHLVPRYICLATLQVLGGADGRKIRRAPANIFNAQHHKHEGWITDNYLNFLNLSSFTNYNLMDFLQTKQIYGPTKFCQTMFIGFNYLITVFWKTDYFFQPVRHDTFKIAPCTSAEGNIMKFYQDIAGFTKLLTRRDSCIYGVYGIWHTTLLKFFRAKYFAWVLEKYWKRILCSVLFFLAISNFRDSQNVGCISISRLLLIITSLVWATVLESSA